MCTSEDMTMDRQTHKDKDTDSKTYMVITILCSPIGHGVISRHTAVDWILQTRSNSGTELLYKHNQTPPLSRPTGKGKWSTHTPI